MTDKRGNLYKELNVDLRRFARADCDGIEYKNLKGAWGPYICNVLRAMGKMPKKKT